MNTHLWWYVARASGIVGWALVTGSVIFGLWVSMRLTRTRPRPAWVLDLHRFLGGLSVIFVGVHLAGLVADSYAHFGLSELLVPFASSWRPTAVAWGIVGVYLLVAVEVTSLLMRRLPRRIWHAIHLSSYGIFVVSTIHMFTAGTDAGSPALQWSAAAGTAAVLFLTIARVLSGRPPRRVVLPPAGTRPPERVPVA